MIKIYFNLVCKSDHRMNSKRFFYLLMLLAITSNANSQTLQILTTDTKTSFRGLSAVNDKVIWASGNNGTIVKSTDGGKSWQSLVVTGYEKKDFRDIEAFDSNVALIMAVAEPALILRTIDGGKNWQPVFEDSTKGMFLDAMDFADENTGMVIGDPVNNKVFLALTVDKGESWIDPLRGDTSRLPSLFTNEAFFASSGTNICIRRNRDRELTWTYVSGGMKSRFFTKNSIFEISMIQGKESTGANSIAINSANDIVVVGGDFKNDKDPTGNCVLSNDYGETWHQPKTPPHGYRSSVCYINKKQLIACGTSGIDISDDGGLNWQLISSESFHVVQKAKKGSSIFLAGNGGRIAKLVFK